jgi:hypothetical protein
MHTRALHQLACFVVVSWPMVASAQPSAATADDDRHWHVSVQFLGLTYHPDGGTTPEVYPLKLEKRAYLVLDVGAAANVDYRIGDHAFVRLTTALYQDCAFVTAGCVHAGPRLRYSRGRSSLNGGIGPILSFREDWHRFAAYQDDEFYGDRVWKGWQYRFFATAAEVEYLRRIGETTELQGSLIPGVPLVVTLLVGVRWAL